MNILHAEGDIQSQNSFNEITQFNPNVKIFTFDSKDDAIFYLNNNFIDLFVISFDGLKTDNENELSCDESMGLFRYVLSRAAFTPICFLSASNFTVDEINYLLSESHHVDVWGGGVSSSTIKVFSKDDIRGLSNEIEELSKSIIQVESIAIDSGGVQLWLKPEQKRILQIFSRQFTGVSCHVKKLDGGLSQSRVLQIRIDDISGASRMHAVAKIDSIENIDKELINYSMEISRLPVSAYAPKVGVVKGGASNFAGIFYRLLKPSDVSLFQLLSDNEGLASEVVVNLQQLLISWYEDRPRENVTIGSIRREMVSDEDVSRFSEKYDLPWIQEVERIYVNSRISSIHGDLHGENVFVSDINKPVMIDFGDVRVGASVFDPITLELSLFTHPSTKEIIEWLPDLSVSTWADLDTYLIDCPYSNFIRACRRWSYDIAGGDQTVNAAAYAYLLRQLKYTDVDHELILDLLKSVKDTILAE